MTLPTPAEIQGDFSQLLTNQVIGTDALNRPIFQGQIFDPEPDVPLGANCVSDPFPGNRIPVNRLDPAASKILSLFPTPNTSFVTSGGYPQNDYFIVTPVAQNIDQGDGRVDYHVSDKDSVFGSLSWSEKSQTNGAAASRGFGRHVFRLSIVRWTWRATRC